MSNDARVKTKQLLSTLSPQEKLLLKEIIIAEQAKLHLGSPHGIIDDLAEIIRRTIK